MKYKSYLAVLLITMLFLSSVNFQSSLAFDSIAGSQVHQEITRSSLPFLKDAVLDEIIDGNDFSFDFNEKHSSFVHFDNCNFYGGSIYIQEKYNQVLNLLESGDTSAAYESFGNLLHPVQDFYAHTNWVELHKGAPIEIFMPGVGMWPTLESFREYSGVVIVQDPTSTQLATLSRTGKVVSVSGVPNGLVSGGVDSWGNCPPFPVGIGHYDIRTILGSAPIESNPYGLNLWFEPATSANYGTGLNKDSSGRPGYEIAYPLAQSQTIQEFCRLINLSASLVSDVAATTLFTNMVDDTKEAIALCEKRGWSTELVASLGGTAVTVPITIKDGIWTLENACREDFTVKLRRAVSVSLSKDKSVITVSGLGTRFDGILEATWDQEKQMYAIGNNTLVPEIPETGAMPGEPIGIYIAVDAEDSVWFTFGYGDCIHPWVLYWLSAM